MIEQRLRRLRKKIRANRKYVIEKLVHDHSANICVVCGSKNDLTKEHVIPRWSYEGNPEKFFVTNVNGLSQKYNQAVVPACSDCNSQILGALENYLETRFRHTDFGETVLDHDDLEKTILWLELIDYKFHILNLRRKLRKTKNGHYIPYLADMPISIMQDLETSPQKILSRLRSALVKLIIKSKAKSISSLVVFRTKNKDFHFFHSTNQFIFIELASHQVAFFYFLNHHFESNEKAHVAAMEIIEKVY
jgi:5-methylcytosine-specific restriction endonuclease McrA